MSVSSFGKQLPITVDKEIMSGTPVFTGTRVPVQTLFDYLVDGCELSEFFDNFPSVSEEAARTILAYAGHQVIEEATAARAYAFSSRRMSRSASASCGQLL